MKKTTILFIQGGGKGAYAADKKLVADLKLLLGKEYNIRYPKMPGENDPDYGTYKATMEEALKSIDGDLLLAGHSLGACFWLKYFTERTVGTNIKGIFLMANPFWGKGGWHYEGFSVNSELAAKRTAHILTFFYHGTKDEVVPFSHLALYKAKFRQAFFRTIEGSDHQLNNDLSDVAVDIASLSVDSQ